MNELKARVFISCGQQKDSEEIAIAQDIADRLINMGFDPYIAVTEQTLKGVKENIFRRLGESEYLIFVDFKRDRLCRLEDGELIDTSRHRGSLFSNQELAIATYLGIECMTFQEQGVVELDGVLRFIQANCTTFTDRNGLPNQVEDGVRDKINEGNWNPNWRNELSMSFMEKVHAITTDSKRPSEWYHLQVLNNHRSRIARNCEAYVPSIRNLDTGEKTLPPQLALSWAGVSSTKKNILPQKYLPLDAFFVFTDTNSIVFKAEPSSSTQYGMPTITKPGNYLLEYIVISDNFDHITKTFKLRFGGISTDIDFTPYDDVEAQ